MNYEQSDYLKAIEVVNSGFKLDSFSGEFKKAVRVISELSEEFDALGGGVNNSEFQELDENNSVREAMGGLFESIKSENIGSNGFIRILRRNVARFLEGDDDDIYSVLLRTHLCNGASVVSEPLAKFVTKYELEELLLDRLLVTNEMIRRGPEVNSQSIEFSRRGEVKLKVDVIVCKILDKPDFDWESTWIDGGDLNLLDGLSFRLQDHKVKSIRWQARVEFRSALGL